MGGSFHIATVGGIPVKIHWTFGLLLVYFGYEASTLNQGIEPVIISIALVLSVFFCVILHEFGHAFTARRYGVRTFDIVMTPIGGIARLERMPEGKGQEFWVALAGPVVNFIIVGLIWLGYFVFRDQALPIFSPAFWQYNGLEPSYFLVLLLSNGYLGTFNLLPAFPMDGGRMLRSLLSLRFSRERATAIASITGQVLAAGLFIYGLVNSQVILAMIGVFIFFSARQENQFLQRQSRLNRLTAANVMEPVMHSYFLGQPIHAIRDTLNASLELTFIVWSRPGIPAGYSTRDRVIRAISQNPFALIDETVIPIPYVVSPETKAIQLIQLMQQHHLPIVLVGDMNGYSGIVTREKLESAID
jgi:Zn-dependent protease